MSRYIDADTAKINLSALKKYNNSHGIILAADEEAISEWIDKQPTADVRENVRGEWVTPTEKVYSIDGEDITSAYKECNRCHKVYVRTNDNFCPNCGADMRGDKT